MEERWGILFSMSWEGGQRWKTSCGGSRLHWTWDEDDKQVNKPPGWLKRLAFRPNPHAQGGHADNGGSSSVRDMQPRSVFHATRAHAHTHARGARTQTQDCCSNTSQRKVDDQRRSSSVWWWRVTFYLIIRIRLHILWCSMMHCGQRRDDTMDKARKLSWAVGKQKFRGWEWSSKKTIKGIIKMKTLRLIKKRKKQ